MWLLPVAVAFGVGRYASGRARSLRRVVRTPATNDADTPMSRLTVAVEPERVQIPSGSVPDSTLNRASGSKGYERRERSTPQRSSASTISCSERPTAKRSVANTSTPEIDGAELDDLCRQAADDAVVAVIGKLDGYRGASRFTTWAYAFAILEVSTKLRRHAWRGRSIPTADDDRLVGSAGHRRNRCTGAHRVDRAPARPAPRGERGADTTTTRGVHRSGAQGRADRRRGRAAPLDPRRDLQGAPRRTTEAPATPRTRRAPRSRRKDMSDRDPLTRLLGTPGEDAGCEGAMALLAVYVEGELAGRNVRALLSRPSPSTCATVPRAPKTTRASPRSSASDATARSRATDRLGSVTTHAVRSAGAGEGRCSPGHRCCRGRAVFERSTRSTTHLPDKVRYALMSGECRSSPADGQSGSRELDAMERRWGGGQCRQQGWSICGAERAQPVATSGKWDAATTAETGENRCRGLRPSAW